MATAQNGPVNQLEKLFEGVDKYPAGKYVNQMCVVEQRVIFSKPEKDIGPKEKPESILVRLVVEPVLNPEDNTFAVQYKLGVFPRKVKGGKFAWQPLETKWVESLLRTQVSTLVEIVSQHTDFIQRNSTEVPGVAAALKAIVISGGAKNPVKPGRGKRI